MRAVGGGYYSSVFSNSSKLVAGQTRIWCYCCHNHFDIVVATTLQLATLYSSRPINYIFTPPIIIIMVSVFLYGSVTMQRGVGWVKDQQRVYDRRDGHRRCCPWRNHVTATHIQHIHLEHTSRQYIPPIHSFGAPTFTARYALGRSVWTLWSGPVNAKG